MADRIVCFVLCGGVGSRLEPLSTVEMPKQFLRLYGEGSMLSSTVARLAARPAGAAQIHLVASRSATGFLSMHLGAHRLDAGSVLLEPVRRDTGMAVAVATAHALRTYGDCLVLVTPSDHFIETSAAFWSSVEIGMDAAREGKLVVFGIRPTRPETGYGYIRARSRSSGHGLLEVKSFHEKPDRATAAAYLAAPDCFWNSGIFLFSAAALRDRYIVQSPKLWYAAASAVEGMTPDGGGQLLDPKAYAAALSISFDKAIAEGAAGLVMVPASFRWCDVGTWRSLVEVTLGRV